MIVSDFVPKVFYQATGKLATFTTGTPKWLKILALANTLIDDWVDEPGVDWNSLYLPDTSIGTVTATNQFTYPSTVRKISDQEGDVIRILHTDLVTYTDYTTIDGNRQKDFANYQRTFQNNFVTNVSNKLQFNRAFASTDPQFGGTIYIPAYGFAGPNPAPNYLVNDTDVIPVDIPNWLVYATAASYDSTDVTRQNWVPRLEAKANSVMSVMKSNNEGQNTRIYQPWRPLGEQGVNEAWN